MSKSIKISLRNDESVDQDLLDLVHLAFAERKKQGLNFTCINYTIEDIKKKAEGAWVFLAYDENKLVGCIFFHTYPDKGNYGYIEVVSVHPDYKGMGIASMIFREVLNKAKTLGVDYVSSDTAVNAKSSVKWHLKNGFKITRLQSSPKSNYYSYVFRNQIKTPSIWNSTLWTNINFLFSSLKCRLMKDKYGRFTFIGKIIQKIKRISRF